MSCRPRFLPALPFGVALLLASCTAVAAAAPAAIRLPAEQARALGVRNAAAVAATGIPLEHLPATVEPALERSAVVTAPYAGTVTRVLAVEGSQVAAGAPLARVQSRERMMLEADAGRAASEARLAARQARRDAELLAEGIVPAARAESSRALQEQSGATQAQFARALALAPAARGGLPGEYELRAPLAGRVLERKVAPGQALEAMAAAFVVADTAQLDVAIRAPAAARMRLAAGQVARIDGTDARGRITAVGSAVDGASQTVPVRARFAAASALVPGQPVAVTLELPAPQGALALPRGALARVGRDSVVFAATQGGYRVVTVEVLGESATQVVVRGPLAAGSAVAVAGTSALKALLAAGE
ncbi:efflux RND transporter periplasmic adaptor subunit [Stenotrophomonas acidaminiphila]|uniref:efflux RND transporter periplasmic adaptor subunit n=1 Tax=Stenotrophomonas acidaminiphila TaxID=128780 RepID=UPI0028A6700B|nr:efflux RND transporter periplasmic adaptor subunit [Stenotrophomonas acidaminiphila]